MLTWMPPIQLRRDDRYIKLGASEIEAATHPMNCELKTAFAMRPRTSPETGTWQRRPGPFILQPFIDAAVRVDIKTRAGSTLWVAVKAATEALTSPHPGVTRFLERALTNYFEYHEAREHEVGPLRLLTNRPEIHKSSHSRLATWGLLYEAQDGSREMRRLRYGTAKSSSKQWAALSVYVVSRWNNPHHGKTMITEIGLVDGQEHRLLEEMTVEEAEELYNTEVKSKAYEALAGTRATPGIGCADCALTPACSALVPMPGFLQRHERGPWTRTVSASALSTYEQCPARWFMERAAHLPAASETTTAQISGMDTHRVLQEAHRREKLCTIEELKDITKELGIDDVTVREFLDGHVQLCPFRKDITLRMCEETLYGYDSLADTVIATKADLIYERGSTLVIRETKTTSGEVADDADLMVDRYFSTSWYLVALEHGLLDHFGASSGQVELEVLTPKGGKEFMYELADEPIMKIARGRVDRAAAEWLADGSWAPRPGPQCTRCPVGDWCNSRATA